MIAQITDISSTYRRILDHRAFVKGEIDLFLNAFELQRNDKEVEVLLKAAQTTGELKSNLSKTCSSLATLHLKNFSDALKNCLDQFEQLPRTQNNSNIVLESSRRARNKLRQDFSDDLAHKYQRIQNTFEEKEEEIIELYSDLERKLNIQK